MLTSVCGSCALSPLTTRSDDVELTGNAYAVGSASLNHRFLRKLDRVDSRNRLSFHSKLGKMVCTIVRITNGGIIFYSDKA